VVYILLSEEIEQHNNPLYFFYSEDRFFIVSCFNLFTTSFFCTQYPTVVPVMKAPAASAPVTKALDIASLNIVMVYS